MKKSQLAFVVPSDLTPKLSLLEEALAEAVQKSKVGSSKEIKFVKYTSEKFDTGSIGDIIVILASSTIAWFTKKWIDEFVWPIIKKKIEKPSEDMLNWLYNIVDKIKKESEND